ncbi:MAG: hypothetical protein H6718_21775 [Polyangiaceae bacterium]|nr:hypothetical protein [Polyangiaceae bacterium]
MWGRYSKAFCRGLIGLCFAGVVVLPLLACKATSNSGGTAATPPMGATGKHSGSYTISAARNPGGGEYTGEVAITQNGQIYLLNWTLGSSAVKQVGVAIEDGTTLAVGLSDAEPYGVVVYHVNGGQLDGTWGLPSMSKLGAESLKGPPGLNGNYQIIKGQNPDGSIYKGTVDITPRGKLYDVRWNIPGNSYSGVGLLSGNVFAVGWGTAKNVGVVLYVESGGKLVGQWGQPGGTDLGAETLTKR